MIWHTNPGPDFESAVQQGKSTWLGFFILVHLEDAAPKYDAKDLKTVSEIESDSFITKQ